MTGPVEPRLLRRIPVARTAVAASVALGLAATVAVVVQAVALAHLLAGAMPGARPDHSRAFWLIWLAGAVAGRGACALASEVVARVGAARIKADLRRRLVGGAAARTAPGGPGPGGTATLAGRGLDALDVYVGRCLPDVVLAAVAPVAVVVAIGAFDWVSMLVVLVGLGLFPVFGALVGRASAALAADRWAQIEDLGRHVADIFEGMPVLKSFGRSAQQRRVIAEAGEALRQASLGTLRVAFLSALVLDELASVSVALVAVPLGLRLLHGALALSSALTVLILAPEVFIPLRRASAEFHQSTEGLAAAASAMDTIPQIEPARGTLVSAGGAGGQVRLAGVRVRVPDREAPVLDGVDLTIHPGETVVLRGPNGAGKSTLIDLLLGFTRPDEGAVLVGDDDLDHLDIQAWRRRIAYLPERPTVLAARLADNLRLAEPGATDEQLIAALRDVGAGSLEPHLDTVIGEGGRPVSAGERQRIALARVLLRAADLYLLDEPTAHLDGPTEALVVDRLRRRLAGRSALIVTHRPAVLDIADRVATLDAGRLLTSLVPT